MMQDYNIVLTVIIVLSLFFSHLLVYVLTAKKVINDIRKDLGLDGIDDLGEMSAIHFNGDHIPVSSIDDESDEVLEFLAAFDDDEMLN